MTLNIMNPKQLEKQLKVIDARIAELETEIKNLEKMRTACRILLGSEIDFTEEPAPEPVTSPKPRREPKPRKPADDPSKAAASEAKPSEKSKAPRAQSKHVSTEELPERIARLLKERSDAMSADDIYDELRSQGIQLGKSAVQTVYATLEKHPELFQEIEEGHWRHAPEASITH